MKQVSGLKAWGLGLLLGVGFALVALGQLVISEVYTKVPGADDGLEWVELYNNTGSDIDLSAYSLGWAGTTWSFGNMDLSGTIGAGETFVIGGPVSTNDNFNPVFDLAMNFNSDIQNAGGTADGVGLFDIPAASVNGSSVPIDAVIYGTTNDNNLVDETGSVNPPDVGEHAQEESLVRTSIAGDWAVEVFPNPNTTQLTPIPPVVLTEVLTNPPGSDNGKEWVELYNAGSEPVNLTGWSLGWGGTSYRAQSLDLSGTIPPNATFVIGGPTSGADNGMPVFDLAVDFNADIQNAGTVADAIGLSRFFRIRTPRN